MSERAMRVVLLQRGSCSSARVQPTAANRRMWPSVLVILYKANL